MIKVLGAKVVLMIALLALANAAAGYCLYEYLVPARETREAELNSLKAEVEARRQEVARLKEEFVMLQRQLRDFKVLEAQGFFNNQNRVKAQESFNELRRLSGLLKTKYDIASGQLIEDPQAVAANHVILMSPVSLEMESLDDVDVYTFIKGLQEKYPGDVDLTDIKLDRSLTMTPLLLRKIGTGSPITMVKANVKFDWRTMAAKDKLYETDRSVSSQESSVPALSVTPAVNATQPVQPVVQTGAVQ